MPTSGGASVEKALALMDRIIQDNGRTPLGKLGEAIGLPRSTLYRLAGVLEAAGLIAKIETGRYVAGVKLLRRVAALSVNGQLARLARPLLRRLAREFGATAHLGVMEADMVTYLVKESAPGAPPILIRENSQLEAYCSGIGKVLLAWLPRPERERYLASGQFVALTPHTITDPACLRRCLRGVRAARFARDDGEVAETIHCLAVPVLHNRNTAIAGISLSFTTVAAGRHDAMTCLAALQSCAQALSQKLGG